MTRVARCIPEVTGKCIIDVKPLGLYNLYFVTVLAFYAQLRPIRRMF